MNVSNCKTKIMKKYILTFALIITTSLIFGQTSFNTGSAEFDANLSIIDIEAKADLPKFKTDLKTDFNISIPKIDQMISLKMEPGEIYLALEIAKIAKRPIDDVIKSYNVNKGKGWGYIAKEMGIKPGSPEFHALKGKGKNKSSKGKGAKPKKGNGNNNGHGNKGGKKK